ncbi:50S ribosomal protein L10 [Candidatus Peregrinibacteria bacterium]|nr:50S ribosomal protein L10 [Candidatus Peregrinibacteria bacterium]
MAITKEKKSSVLKKLEEKFAKAQAIYFAENKGLKVKDVTKLRQNLRDQGIDFVVAKKTLMKLAAKNQNLPEISDDLLPGPIAAVIGYEDMIIPSKLVKDFGATVENKIVLTGGIMEGKLLSQAEAVKLASLPSKIQLLAQLVGTMKAPITGFYMVLKGLKDKAPASAEAEAKVETAAAPASAEPAAAEAPAATENAAEAAPAEATPPAENNGGEAPQA